VLSCQKMFRFELHTHTHTHTHTYVYIYKYIYIERDNDNIRTKIRLLMLILLYYSPHGVKDFIDILLVVLQTRFSDYAFILFTLLKERVLSERGFARNHD
jgi:hypothetical protein